MRLLVVEDSERLKRSLRLGLRRAGYVVDEAGDGNDAQWKAEEMPYDVIILDLMLPGKGGIEIVRSLRQKGIQTHVLILTARDAVEDRVLGLQAGADDYLVKPFAFDELLARIQALGRRSYHKKSSVVTVGDLTIDLNRHDATVKGKNLDLLPREFRIVEFLALHEGEVISRPAIEENIYEDQVELASNTVESAISRLRKKLRALGSDVTIETTRGVGYSLSSKVI